MKKVKKFHLWFLLALTALITVGVYAFAGGKTAEAYTSPLYAFEVAKYDVTYDIQSNCEISVTEEITISYLGQYSTGFKRDIPANGGVQIRNVTVQQIKNGTAGYVWYDVNYEESDFLTVDIGDYDTVKYNTQETYRIMYDYKITNSVVNKSMLPVNPIGHGWDCDIYNASVKLILPKGFTQAKCYVGTSGSNNEYKGFNSYEQNGRTVISANFGHLATYNGVTFDLSFENGSINNYTDVTPYVSVVIGLIIVAAVIILKFFVFNKNSLMPVVNYEAPNKMDPLMMGKLIDNKVNNEDVTSMIFYWASKGYIKINLDDKNDPTIIRIMQTLPEPCPAYENLMYNNLFKSGDMVKPSQLKNSFYKTVEQVTASVNKNTKNLYDGKSSGISIFFAILSGLLASFTPILIGLTVSMKLLYILGLAIMVPAILIYLLTRALMYNKLKFKKSTFTLSCAGIVLLCFVVGIFYVLIIPSSIMATVPKILLYTVCAVISCTSVLLVCRTKEYTEKLNDIIGFKNFISLAEKDQLEMMLEEDPQFYYHVLPYAQVLGVTDKWEDKFKNLTIQPPQWIAGDGFTTYMEFRLINVIIRSSMGSITSGMVSRPSSSGANGGRHGGGFGGGFSGGGFGGGGGRGR